MKRLFMKLGTFLLLITVWILISNNLINQISANLTTQPVANIDNHPILCVDGIGTPTTTPCQNNVGYLDIQSAIDAGDGNAEIRIALGTFSAIVNRGGFLAIAHIDGSYQLKGGYALDNWDSQNGITILDAQTLGRAIHIYPNSTVSLDALQITNGNAEGQGGFYGNDAGGGVFADSNSVVTITNALITNNMGIYRAPGEKHSRGYGGGVFGFQSRFHMSHTTIKDNFATNGAGAYIYQGLNSTFYHVTIDSNHANHLGPGQKHNAGLALKESHGSIIYNSWIINNTTANNGGGLIIIDSDDVLVDNVEFEGNKYRGGFEGAGISLFIKSSQNVNIINSEIKNTGNLNPSAPGKVLGGGAFIGANSTVKIDKCKFIGNEALQGAAIYIHQSHLELDNTIFDLNLSDEGTILFLEDDSMVVASHNTFVGKFNEGIRQIGESSSLQLNSSIFTQFETAVYVEKGTTLIQHPLWFSNVTDTFGVAAEDINNPHTGDPKFADAAHGDFEILTGSAAQDRGLAEFPKTDHIGNKRPYFTTLPDIGAIEIQDPSSIHIELEGPEYIGTFQPTLYSVTVAPYNQMTLLTYEWDSPENFERQADLNNATNLLHLWTSPGEKLIQVEITDGQDSFIVTQSVKVDTVLYFPILIK